MGHRKKSGGSRGGKNGGKAREQYATIEKDNELFRGYYKAQCLLPEEEWDTMIDSFRASLPTSFRLAGSRLTAKSLNASIMNHYIPSLKDVEFEGERPKPPLQLPWYPDGLAWQFNVSKKILRKHPDFKKFHSFLVYETEGGNISRQEAVSMIPPLFLGVQPHHKTLDMCAAPGSKTAQLLEALHANDNPTIPSLPSGVVIANDSDYKRTHMLIHQAARLPSPAFMVTNIDAGHYPSMKLPSSTNGKTEQMFFDRILCDVPCSGDGTLRKNPSIWKTWSPGDGNGLHSLQLRILQRAMKLLAPGGRIVYSTCSLNPIENEAVVAEALRSNPTFALVDVSDSLPELKRRPGLTTWRVAANKSVNVTYSSFQEYEEKLPASERTKSKLGPSHWPPVENVESFHLTRCMRLYPHLQDTGGFFVAVFERPLQPSTTTIGIKRSVDELDEEPLEAGDSKKIKLEGVGAMSTSNATSSVDAIKLANVSAPQPNFKEDPYTYLKPDDPYFDLFFRERLQLKDEFPWDTVLVRNPDGTCFKTIVEHNNYAKIRLTAAGTKIFVKQEAGKGFDAQFRILGEGLSVVLPFLKPESIQRAHRATLKTLLSSYYPLFISFDEEFQKLLATLANGSLILHARYFHAPFLIISIRHPSSLLEDVVVPLWKAQASLSLMIDKKAKSAMSIRLFGEDITPSNKEQNPSAKLSHTV
ncbi:S-adenosyl-L-methionine-dependent methyltransferase [Flagelloscypha sp. PMI_526]|nr:S-adenosyl-L-methionine-dependent methyltransferase [Flagelloscypha sp. PMI_526]